MQTCCLSLKTLHPVDQKQALSFMISHLSTRRRSAKARVDMSIHFLVHITIWLGSGKCFLTRAVGSGRERFHSLLSCTTGRRVSPSFDSIIAVSTEIPGKCRTQKLFLKSVQLGAGASLSVEELEVHLDWEGCIHWQRMSWRHYRGGPVSFTG